MFKAWFTFLERLRESVSKVLEGLNSSKNGVMSPGVVTPKDFMGALVEIKNNLKLDLNYLFSLSKSNATENYSLYMSMSRFDIIVGYYSLVYLVKTPIPMSDVYKVIELTPLPMSILTKYFMYDNLSDKPIALKTSMAEYTYVDSQTCFSFDEYKICELTNPMHSLSAADVVSEGEESSS